MLILVVDDEPAVREAVERALRLDGHDVSRGCPSTASPGSRPRRRCDRCSRSARLWLLSTPYASIEDLAAQEARFRGEMVEGPGGRQILIEDPAGNPVELFQPKRARRAWTFPGLRGDTAARPGDRSRLAYFGPDAKLARRGGLRHFSDASASVSPRCVGGLEMRATRGDAEERGEAL
jgi:hypothetical protein